MTRLHNFQRYFKRDLILIGGIALSLYFSYHAVYGVRSYAALLEMNAKLEERLDDLSAVSTERAMLEKKVAMLRPETLSIDLLEERARYMLGYKKAQEVVVFKNTATQN